MHCGKAYWPASRKFYFEKLVFFFYPPPQKHIKWKIHVFLAWGAQDGTRGPKIRLEKLLNMFYKIWYFLEKFENALGFSYMIFENCGSKIG